MDVEEKVIDQTETEAKETVEEKDSLIVEQDGEIYLKQETEEPETEPEGKTGEGQAEVTEKGVSDDIDPAYKGKSVSDVIQMHKEASRKISEQGGELGKLRKQTENAEMTPEQLRQSLTVTELQVGLKSEREKLRRIDPVLDPDDYGNQQEIVTQLEVDWLQKRQDEQIKDRFNSKENQEFKASQKERFTNSGIDMSDDDFSDVSGIAENYLEDGKYTEQAYQKAMIDKFGVDKMVKFYTMNGEKKAREDIVKAEGKQMTKVDVKGSGKNAKLIRINDLPRHELRKTLDTMSPEELKQLYSRVNQ